MQAMFEVGRSAVLKKVYELSELVYILTFYYAFNHLVLSINEA